MRGFAGTGPQSQRKRKTGEEWRMQRWEVLMTSQAGYSDDELTRAAGQLLDSLRSDERVLEPVTSTDTGQMAVIARYGVETDGSYWEALEHAADLFEEADRRAATNLVLGRAEPAGRAAGP
jgi:hypothetical protein